VAATHQKSEAILRGARMLRTALGPAIARFLEDPAIVEVMLNPDGRLWVDRLSEGLSDTGELLSPSDGERIIRLVAHHVGAEVHPGAPRVSAELPETGERFEGLLPPVVSAPAFAIRKPAVAVFTLGDYVAAGIMAADQAETLRQAVADRRNILVAGGTSTGKTTFLNALLKEVPRAERLILIEDAAEVQLDHPNALGLLAVRGDNGEARVTAEDLVQASLRMRPDRIILGELRGREAVSFLRAVNTGHPGSITTLHADSPRGAVEQLAMLVLQSGVNLGRAEIADYVRNAVDVFVQLSRRNGRRVISEIAFQQGRS
jgi:P-type conjugative transfer ATPase TrbB